MTLVKDSRTFEDRYQPAHDLAARATSKHGNPAAYAIVCSVDLITPAHLAAAQVYSEACALDDRSHHGNGSISVGRGPQPPIAMSIDVAPVAGSTFNHAGFSLKFAPRSVYDAGPSFEGQVRVDHVDAARSRVVVQGRFTGGTTGTTTAAVPTRTEAEDALRQIVDMLTASLSRDTAQPRRF